MEKIKIKNKNLLKALDRLYESIVDFKEQELKQKDPESNIIRTYRDSMIKRFEFSIDLFWKYLKIYIEEILDVDLAINSPKNIVREACKIKLISEPDAEKFLTMLDDRNMSSRIYKEEVADDISSRIPEHYKIMEKYTQKLKPEKPIF